MFWFAKVRIFIEYKAIKRDFFSKNTRNRLQFRRFFILLWRDTDTTKMKATEQTLQQIERAIRKIAEKFPANDEATQMTDVHIRVTQESGELMAFDDDDNELNRCIIEQWIDNKDDDFYEQICSTLRKCLDKQKKMIEQMSILKPFSFVLEDDDKQSIAELYFVDDNVVIIDPDLMEGLDKDLDDFLDKLLAD